MHPAFCDALELANALVSMEKQESGENLDEAEAQHRERNSPTSSDSKSDTCPLMERHNDAEQSRQKKSNRAQ